MSRYEKLTNHLSSLPISEWTASFADIEAILGFQLPRSAYQYPAWWSNQSSKGHSQSAAWQSVGWRTEQVNLAEQRLTFVRNHRATITDKIPLQSETGPTAALTMSQAKAGLAAHYGVPVENIEITIRG